jgi:hypothetical protein
MIVLSNDYELLKIFLQRQQGQANIKNLDFQAQDVHGRNPQDLALELGYQKILQLLERYGGYAQVQNVVKTGPRNVKMRFEQNEANRDQREDPLAAPLSKETATFVEAI